MIWIIIAGLVVVLVIAGAIGSSGGSSSTSNRGTRAVIVPTADAPRTVVVPPCGTGTAVSSAKATALMNTTGTTSVELPQGQGLRVVLIPKCSAGHGGSSGSSNLPSAVFVTRPGAPLPSIGTARNSSSSQAAAPQDAQFQLSVPSGSPIRTIIVSPCQQPQRSRAAEQILSVTGGSTTAVAPSC